MVGNHVCPDGESVSFIARRLVSNSVGMFRVFDCTVRSSFRRFHLQEFLPCNFQRRAQRLSFLDLGQWLPWRKNRERWACSDWGIFVWRLDDGSDRPCPRAFSVCFGVSFYCMFYWEHCFFFLLFPMSKWHTFPLLSNLLMVEPTMRNFNHVKYCSAKPGKYRKKNKKKTIARDWMVCKFTIPQWKIDVDFPCFKLIFLALPLPFLRPLCITILCGVCVTFACLRRMTMHARARRSNWTIAWEWFRREICLSMSSPPRWRG